jgi:WD40 repeat protein
MHCCLTSSYAAVCSAYNTLLLPVNGDCFSVPVQVYALLCDKLVTLHSAAQEGAVTARLQHSRRVVSLLQQQDGSALLAGLDDGQLALWDLRAQQQQPVLEIEKAHGSRIRAIVSVTAGEWPCGDAADQTHCVNGRYKLEESELSDSSG